VNASIFRRGGECYVKLYCGDEVYDVAGPFDDQEDAEFAAYRMVDGRVSRGALEVAANFAPGGAE